MGAVIIGWCGGLLSMYRGTEGGVDAGVGLGIQDQVGVAHPGLAIDPAPYAALAALLLMTGGAVVAGQHLRQLGDLAAERFHRRHRRRGDECLGEVTQCVAAMLIQRGGGTGQAVGMPR
jgi:hypothetical protein